MKRLLLLALAACAAPTEHLPAPGAMGPYSSGVGSGMRAGQVGMPSGFGNVSRYRNTRLFW